jgi:hypothetical protein
LLDGSINTVDTFPMLEPSLATTELPSICETSSEASGSFIGVLLLLDDGALFVDEGALLPVGAAVCAGGIAPEELDDCAEAAPAPKASKAATAAAVANFGTTRVMSKPR